MALMANFFFHFFRPKVDHLKSRECLPEKVNVDSQKLKSNVDSELCRGTVTTRVSPRALKGRRTVTDPRCVLPLEGSSRRTIYCRLLKTRKETVILTLSDLPPRLGLARSGSGDRRIVFGRGALRAVSTEDDHTLRKGRQRTMSPRTAPVPPDQSQRRCMCTVIGLLDSQPRR